MIKKLVFILPVLFVFFTSCSEQYDTSVFDDAKIVGESNSTATYIEIFPQWEINYNGKGLNDPQALLYGNETLLYICDTGNDRVLMLNSAGTVLGAIKIKHPIAIAQDYKLNLFICGKDVYVTKDTNNVVLRTDTVSAVFKVDLYAVNHHLENAVPVRLLPDKNYSFSLDFKLEYTGVCAFYDNSVYIARQGPNNTKEPPDNSFLHFRKKDPAQSEMTIERVPGLLATGTGFLSVNKVTSITAFKKKNMDFIVTTASEDGSFKAQWLYLNTSSENQKFESKLPVSSKMMTPKRFSRVTGSCIDNKQNMFVVDPDSNMIYKFNSYGEEMESFGGAKYGFNLPTSVAFYDKTVYISDTKNNKIRRFRLSSEFR